MADDLKETTAPESDSSAEGSEKSEVVQEEQIQELKQHIKKLEETLVIILERDRKHDSCQARDTDERREQRYTRLADKPALFLLGVGCTLILVPISIVLFRLISTGLMAVGSFLGFTKHVLLGGAACIVIGTGVLVFISPLAKVLAKLIYELEDEEEYEL